MMPKLISSFAFIAACMFVSCKPAVVHDYEKTMLDEAWSWSDTITSSFTNHDTLQTFNVYLTINLLDHYPYSNLYLFVSTVLPDETVLKDTINCFLANNRGQWLGKWRFGKIKNKLPYRQNVRFPEQGEYTFVLEQAMRVNPVKGVHSCGIRIEEYQ